MRFFFLSPFSIIFLVVIYFIGTWILVAIGSRLRKKWKYAWVSMAPLFLALYIGPIAEELWIAWNFGQLCKKDAGLFIHKTVEVEGFYDDTTHWWRQLENSNYQFVESRDNTYGGVFRVERSANGLRHFKIDTPTARYHYKRLANRQSVAHGVKRFENVVIDVQREEVMARYLNYRRDPPWFFIALDRPTMQCRETENEVRKHGTLMLYALALKPASK